MTIARAAAGMVLVLALLVAEGRALACEGTPEDAFEGETVREAPLVARGRVQAVEDVVCVRDTGGGVPIDHNCTARLLVTLVESYRGSETEVSLQAKDITLLMPFATGGYSVAAGDVAPQVAAGLVRDIVFLADGPAEGPDFSRPVFRVLAGACLQSAVRSHDDPAIAGWLDRVRLEEGPGD